MKISIKTLIVDDEPLARSRINSLLQKEPDIEIIGECSNGKEAVKTIKSAQPDLVFLDIQMPEMDGFGVLEALKGEKLPIIVFITAFDQHALRAFELHAVDYLLKPFDQDRFSEMLNHVRTQVQQVKESGLSQQIQALLDDRNNQDTYLKRFAVKTSDKVFFVRTDDITWIEAAGNYVNLHVGKDAHLIRDTMSGVAGRLDPEKFIRIHRSTIVNIESIKELQPWFHGEYVVVLEDATQLRLSRNHRAKMQALLGNVL